MNYLDKLIATNICTLFLFSSSLLLLMIGLNSDMTLGYISFTLAFLTLLFNLKVLSRNHQRKKLFQILKDKIDSNGYSRDIFVGKCTTICSFFICLYILIRLNKTKDIPFLVKCFTSKKRQAIHDDPEIQKAINQALLELKILPK